MEQDIHNHEPLLLYPSESPPVSSSSNSQFASTVPLRCQRSIIKLEEGVWGALASLQKVSSLAGHQGEDEPKRRSHIGSQHFTEGREGSNEAKRKYLKAFIDDSSAEASLVTREMSLEDGEIQCSPSPSLPALASSLDDYSNVHLSQYEPRIESRSDDGFFPPQETPELLPDLHPVLDSIPAASSRPRSSTNAISIALDSPVEILQAPLSIRDYERFLLNSPIDPRLSFELPQIQLEFFCSILHPRLWSNRPHSAVFSKSTFFSKHAQILERSLDFASIRKGFPLRSRYDREFERIVSRNWTRVKDALCCVYSVSVSRDKVFDFLANAPLPLLVLGKLIANLAISQLTSKLSTLLLSNLARLHGEVIRYQNAVAYAARDFLSYLIQEDSAFLTPFQRRAKKLVIWLSSPNDGVGSDRWKNWWCQEVDAKRERKRSLTQQWIDAENGWDNIKSLEEWEETKLARRWR